MRVAMAIAALALATACQGSKRAERTADRQPAAEALAPKPPECVEWKTVRKTVFVFTGGSAIPLKQGRRVCVRYAEPPK